MIKLKLNLDALAVESFETGQNDGTGTIHGQALQPLEPEPITDKSPLMSCKTCFGTCRTCDISCGGTCFDATCLSCFTCATCGESCGPTMCQATFPDNCCVIV